MSKTQTKISKLISYWLRHKPQDAKIQLDEFGWANIEAILEALKTNQIECNKDDLITLSNSFDKVRWKIDKVANKIKATHGHSISILQEEEPQTPPEILYHGTATRFIESIMDKGLISKQRQYVHLSETIDMAKEVAQRHGKPVIIEIETKALIEHGWKFYKTEQDVWLTSEIPFKSLDIEPWDFIIDKETKGIFLKELKKEINREHLLSDKIDKLELIARYGPSDDCLFKNQENNEYFVVHLTWSGKKEKDSWPLAKQFDNFEEFLNTRLVADQDDWYGRH